METKKSIAKRQGMMTSSIHEWMDNGHFLFLFTLFLFSFLSDENFPCPKNSPFSHKKNCLCHWTTFCIHQCNQRNYHSILFLSFLFFSFKCFIFRILYLFFFCLCPLTFPYSDIFSSFSFFLFIIILFCMGQRLRLEKWDRCWWGWFFDCLGRWGEMEECMFIGVGCRLRKVPFFPSVFLSLF